MTTDTKAPCANAVPSGREGCTTTGARWRAVLAAMVAAVLALGTLGLFGCGAATPEDAIRSSLTQTLNGIKNRDNAFLSEIQDDLDVDRFSEYGIDGAEFMRAYFDGFDYTINDITVDGNTAVATVTLQCKSFSQYRDQLTAATKELVGDRANLASLSNEEKNAAYGALIMETIETVDSAPTAAFTITYELNESTNTWEPVDAVEYEISSAILTN